MMDECVGHMTEKVVIPTADEIDIEPRKLYTGPADEYLPYLPDSDMIPWMTRAGDGTRFHTTGLTHDEKGYPVMNADCQETLVRRLVDKIRKNVNKIVILEEEEIDGADVIVVSYGISSRVAIPAIERARSEGLKVGSLKLVTVWPFPEDRIRELAGQTGALVIPEMNYGQIYYEIERCAAGQAKTILIPHGGGWVHDSEDIYQGIRSGLI
jgi:2-oxoglutarate ferredoxin oxidoreductase subunit alpha